MARNLNDLANSLTEFAKNVKTIGSDKAVVVASTLLDTLLKTTPVDTSTALSNWQVTLGAPSSNFIDAYVPGFLGYTAIASINEANQIGNAVLANKKPGDSIYISNNAPYIINLNSGSSKQAPAGFVEAAILIARNSMKK